MKKAAYFFKIHSYTLFLLYISRPAVLFNKLINQQNTTNLKLVSAPVSFLHQLLFYNPTKSKIHQARGSDIHFYKRHHCWNGARHTGIKGNNCYGCRRPFIPGGSLCPNSQRPFYAARPRLVSSRKSVQKSGPVKIVVVPPLRC